MTFRRHAVAVLSFVAVATIVVSSAVTHALFDELTTAVEQGNFELMEATVESKLRNTESRAHSRASMVADTPSVRRLFAARDREGLLADMSELFRVQQEQFGAAQMHFHVPPAVSFLRMHDPEHNGDSLTYRPMVVAVNQDWAPRHGAYIGRSGPAIAAVVPVKDLEGHPVGTVEIGLDWGPVLDDLKESFGLDATFFVLEEPIRTNSTGVTGNALDPQNRVGSYLKWYSTNWSLTQELVTGDDLGAATEVITYSREASGAPYGVVLHPIRDGAGEMLGVIAVARDFSATRASAGRTLVWQCLIALFASIVMIGAIAIVVRGLLLRPLAALNARFTELAQGKRDAKIDGVEGMPFEMRELAAVHEHLRREGIPDEGEREGAA